MVFEVNVRFLVNSESYRAGEMDTPVKAAAMVESALRHRDCDLPIATMKISAHEHSRPKTKGERGLKPNHPRVEDVLPQCTVCGGPLDSAGLCTSCNE